MPNKLSLRDLVAELSYLTEFAAYHKSQNTATKPVTQNKGSMAYVIAKLPDMVGLIEEIKTEFGAKDATFRDGLSTERLAWETAKAKKITVLFSDVKASIVSLASEEIATPAKFSTCAGAEIDRISASKLKMNLIGCIDLENSGTLPRNAGPNHINPFGSFVIPAATAAR